MVPTSEFVAEQRSTAAVGGTTITVAVAAPADVEHSKRTADRPKDRLYLERGGRTAPNGRSRGPRALVGATSSTPITPAPIA